MPVPVGENRLAADLDAILARTDQLWEDLRGQRIFLTGGTGFFGCWLLESFAWANAKLGLNASITVLSRNPSAFYRKLPYLARNTSISFHAGDVRWFDYPAGTFSCVLHAATETDARRNAEDPFLLLDTMVQGTRRTLDFAVACEARKFLLVSSGAVYGKQPPDLTHIPETLPAGPDPLDVCSTYGEGKRMAELLCAMFRQRYGLAAKVARCFTFVGPHLPLDRHFAAGNFIRDALLGQPIQVRGDGTACRSYLYAADLAVWLWTILLKGQPGRPYNVGSEHSISVAELARQVSSFESGMPINIAGKAAPGAKPERYVPDTTRARTELGLQETVPLRAAIRRTMDWSICSSPRVC